MHPPRLIIPRLYKLFRAKRLTNVGLMLGERLRRWPNIKPTLVQRLMLWMESLWIIGRHDELFVFSSRPICILFFTSAWFYDTLLSTDYLPIIPRAPSNNWFHRTTLLEKQIVFIHFYIDVTLFHANATTVTAFFFKWVVVIFPTARLCCVLEKHSLAVGKMALNGCTIQHKNRVNGKRVYIAEVDDAATEMSWNVEI